MSSSRSWALCYSEDRDSTEKVKLPTVRKDIYRGTSSWVSTRWLHMKGKGLMETFKIVQDQTGMVLSLHRCVAEGRRA